MSDDLAEKTEPAVRMGAARLLMVGMVHRCVVRINDNDQCFGVCTIIQMVDHGWQHIEDRGPSARSKWRWRYDINRISANGFDEDLDSRLVRFGFA